MDRRQFIVNSGRFLLLSSLAAVGGVTLLKKKNVATENCRLNNICTTCKELKDCSLPQASAFK